MLILDFKKNPFYWHSNEAQHINFNLPPGSYYCNVDIYKQKEFKPYVKKDYPRLPRSFVNDVMVYNYPNPHKASISLENRFVIADTKFYEHEYRPLQTFTMCHELFHYEYHAKNARERKNKYIREFIERQCDHAARTFMLSHGWNPSQVRLACALLLRGQGRKTCIYNSTTHPKNKFRR